MCDCIQQFNEALEIHNTKIVIPIWLNKSHDLNSGSVFILTEKVDSKKRGGPKKLMASYCPFCGEKYRKD